MSIHPLLSFQIGAFLSLAADSEPAVSTLVAMLSHSGIFVLQRQCKRSCGPMDKASDYESGDCRFESCQDHKLFILQTFQCSFTAFELQVSTRGGASEFFHLGMID